MKHFTKKTIALLLALMMIAGIVPFASIAEIDFSSWFVKAEAAGGTYLTSGYCGDTSDGKDRKNIYWEIDADGVLTLTGTGKMGSAPNKGDLRVKRVVVKDGIENICYGAFYGCSNLIEVSLPESIREISGSAFRETSITDIVFPNHLETIGMYAFMQSKLVEVHIPSSVRSLEYMAFYHCKIATCELSEGLQIIGGAAFANNTIESLSIPNSVISMGFAAFENNNITSLNIGSGLTELSREVFKLNKNLNNVVIPSNIQTIGPSAFVNCNGLTQVIFNEGLRFIDSQAFQYTTIEQLILPDSLETISSGAFFQNKNSFETIHFGKNLQSLSSNAFSAVSENTSIDISEANEYYFAYDNVVYDADSFDIVLFPSDKSSYTVPEWVSDIPVSKIGKNVSDISVVSENAFFASSDGVLYSKDLKKLICCPKGRKTNVSILSGVTTICEYAFTEVHLTSNNDIDIPSSVTEIEPYAFYNSNLKPILHEGIISIGTCAFRNIGLIQELYIPDTCTFVGENAFLGAKAKKIYIGANIQGDVNNYGLYRCVELREYRNISG